MGCCVQRANGVAPGGAAAAAALLAEYELDFSLLANETLATGVTDTNVGGQGVDWLPTIATGDDLAYVLGTGLRGTITDTTTTYTGSSQTASHYECVMGDMYDQLSVLADRVIDARNQIEVYAYYTSLPIIGNFQEATVCVRGDANDPTSSSDRMRGSYFLFAGGGLAVGVKSDTSTDNMYPYLTSNVACVQLGVNNAQGLFGVWDTDLDVTPFRVQMPHGIPSTAEPSKIENNFLGVGFGGSSANAWVCDLERIIVRAY